MHENGHFLIMYLLKVNILSEKLIQHFLTWSDGYAQSFVTITQIKVKASNLADINKRIGDILKLSYFWKNLNSPISHKDF